VPTSASLSALRLAIGGLLLVPAAALAAPAGLDDAQLARHDALLARLQAHVDPMAADLAPAEMDHGPACLTGLVRDLQEGRDLFTDAEWQDIADSLGLLVDVGGPDDSLPPPPAPLGDVSCLGRQGANYIVGDHFVVEWDSTSISEDTAQDALTALEESWDIEINDRNWRQPDGTSSYPMLFYISNQNYAGAYTTVTYCSGEGYIPYIVSGRGSFSAGNWYKTMAAHEFNHSSQFGYGYGHEFYWWEATATWMEEYVYPEYNDWADMYVGFPYYPYIALNASDQQDQAIFYHMYAMGILGTYLDEYIGGHDLVQDTWENAISEGGTYSYWMPEVIADLGLDFGEVWTGFMATVAFMDFSEYRYYYSVLDTNQYEEATALPANGSTPDNGPQSLGMNFVYFDKGLGADGKYLQVDFSGAASADDWYVVLVTGSDHTVREMTRFELVDGEGSAWVPFNSGDEAFLVLSPKDADAQGMNYNWADAPAFPYGWEACLVDTETGVACGEEPPATDSGDAGDAPLTPGEGTGCGCSSQAAPVTGLAWGLGLLGLAVRRRRD